MYSAVKRKRFIVNASAPTVKRCIVIWNTATSTVTAMPMKYIPAPRARPIPAVAHIPAAVVSPFTVLPFLNITPAPRKLMPLTTCAAIRAGSAPRVPLNTLPSAYVRSAKPYLDTIIISAAAQHTMMCVRIPASLKRFVRSKPMHAPQKQAANILTKKSTFCIIEN